jgi:hypothetical protein
MSALGAASWANAVVDTSTKERTKTDSFVFKGDDLAT